MPSSCPSRTAKSQDRTAWLKRNGSERVRAKSIAWATSGVSITVTPPRTCVFPPVMARLGVGDMEFLSLDEGEQIRVDLILMRGSDAVRRARVVDVLRALDESSRLPGRVLHRNDLVVFAVQYERGHVEFFQIFCLIRFGKCLNAFVSVQETRLHAPKPKLIEHSLRDSCP